MIYRIAETTSTNDDAKRPEYRHGDIVWAERQTAGRGQRGHSWTSPEGENLTFTLVLEPVFLPVGEQFLLSEAVTLALTDTFAAFGIDARIKWTNDIYVGDKKLVGILIEHSYSGPTLARTIAGIGINVNQRAFDPALPNPVSMAVASGRTFDRREVLVGLSTDKDAGAWKKAIAEDGMAWINLTDADRRVCDLYSVTKFPTNYLIDCSTGEVVARELRGKALAETLGELFKQ